MSVASWYEEGGNPSALPLRAASSPFLFPLLYNQNPNAAKAKTARAAAIPIPAFAPADRPLDSLSMKGVLVAALEEAGTDMLGVVDGKVDVDVDVLEEDETVVDALALA